MAVTLYTCRIALEFQRFNHNSTLSSADIDILISDILNGLPKSWGFNVEKKFPPMESDKHVPMEMIVVLSSKTPFYQNIAECFLHLSTNIVVHTKKVSGRVGISFRVLDNAFPDTYNCADGNLHVPKIVLGLVYKGMMVQHTELNPKLDSRTCHNFPVGKERRSFVDHLGGPCYVLEFEHDRQVLQLRMPMVDNDDKVRMDVRRFNNELIKQGESIGFLKYPPSVPGERNFYNEVMIKLTYSNVLRVTFNLVQRMDDGRYAVQLFIQYNHPPSLFVRAVRRDGSYQGRASRYIEWSRSFSIPDILPVLSESSAMRVSLYLEGEQLVNLLNQLSERLKCHVDFSPLETLCVSENYRELPLRTRHWPFEVRYMVEAIFSRGYIGKHRFLRHNRAIDSLVQPIEEQLSGGCEKTLLDALTTIFYEVVQNAEYADGSTIMRYQPKPFIENNPDYVKIKRVYITPTRMLLFPPEYAMGSRIIRHLGTDKIIRVCFRDDSMEHMRPHTCPEHIMNKVVLNALLNGLTIAGERFRYLGYSNSQLRDQGCYFYQTDSKEKILEILQSMGTFKDEGVAKTMARFAQCFTQSRTTEITHLGKHMEVPDYQNLAADPSGKHYIFSDGVGMISAKFAQSIIDEMNVETNPCCFQIRFGGYKGVLSVEPMLDYGQEWLKRHEIHAPKNQALECNVLWRTSQNKFKSNDGAINLEIVKFSSGVPLRLNKPLINIYDQVSSKQSGACRVRVHERIRQYVTMHIGDIIRSLTDDMAFREALGELPLYVPTSKMKSFLTFIDEPFFRSMVMARARHSLKLLNEKKQVNILSNLGRCMFGIVDTTGILQYEQVFVQYTNDVFAKTRGGLTTVIKGKVAVSKNPMCNEGDLRMFDAVDIPALRHLVDVIVFPQHGPRPHPDEMAGSDLDGDEYSVIWDQELYLDYNEPAFNYTPEGTPVERVKIHNLIDESANFFVNYMSQDMIGQVANAHLENADLYGLESDICAHIARKQTTAVDFAKTGVPMEPLTTKWMGDLPPEKCERHPDFMSKDYQPSYESPRLLGEIHRKIKRFTDVVTSVVSDVDEKPIMDAHIDVPGWERYREEAEKMYARYSEELSQIVVGYGVVNEGELFSQCFTNLKNRFNTRETDNMSGFTTSTLIQTLVFNIFCRYRAEFFQPFGYDFAHYVATDQKLLLREKVMHISDNMRLFVVACYKVAYGSGNFLSFPWIAWDVIDDVRLRATVPIVIDCLGTHVSTEVMKLAQTMAGFEKFKDNITRHVPAIEPYILRYKGLSEIMYFLSKWLDQRKEELANITKSELLQLFIRFGLGLMPMPKGCHAFLTETAATESEQAVDLHANAGGIGRRVISFFSMLASEEFLNLPFLNFCRPNLGKPKIKTDNEDWRPLHDVGLVTYLNIACKVKPVILQPYNRHGYHDPAQSLIVKGAPFVIEVPTSVISSIENIVSVIRERTGIAYIAYRIHWQNPVFRNRRELPLRPNTQVTLWPKGTPTQIQLLRKMVTIKPTFHRGEQAEVINDMIGILTMRKIQDILGHDIELSIVKNEVVASAREDNIR